MNIIDVRLNFKSMTYGNIPNKIILHNADASSCTVQDIHRWHLNNGWSGIGYHYFIRKDGSIYKGRPDNAIGSHCKGNNTGSLGICFEGKYMSETMPQAQYNAGIELIKYLFDKYKIMPIYGHKELFNTDCPGINFPLSDFKQLKKKTKYKLGWNRNSTEWWYCTDAEKGYYYRDLDWKEIDGTWYSFDSDGYARTGWLQYKGHWYYLKEEDTSEMCKMARNEWVKIDGKEYYFNDSGIWDGTR